MQDIPTAQKQLQESFSFLLQHSLECVCSTNKNFLDFSPFLPPSRSRRSMEMCESSFSCCYGKSLTEDFWEEEKNRFLPSISTRCSLHSSLPKLHDFPSSLSAEIELNRERETRVGMEEIQEIRKLWKCSNRSATAAAAESESRLVEPAACESRTKWKPKLECGKIVQHFFFSTRFFFLCFGCFYYTFPVLPSR